MEGRHYSTILNSIPSFSGTLHQNIAERLDIVSLKFDIIVTILDKAADLFSNLKLVMCWNGISHIVINFHCVAIALALLLLLFPVSSLLLEMWILNYFVIKRKVMMDVLVMAIFLLLIFIENMLLKWLIFKSSIARKPVWKLHHMRCYKLKNLIQTKLSSSKLSLLKWIMLSFMLEKVNPSLIELLFQLPISILPLLLHAGIYYSIGQSLQSYIILRYTRFLYCQLVLIFVSRPLPRHLTLVIHSILSFIHLLIMASTSMMALLVIVVLLFATPVTNLATSHPIAYLGQKNKVGTGWLSDISIS